MTGQAASYLEDLNALAASGFTLPETAKELSIS